MSRKLEQDQGFEAVLGEQYRRAAGVKDSFVSGLMKRNRGQSTPAKKHVELKIRQLADRLIGAK
jgi:hypothetical protein